MNSLSYIDLYCERTAPGFWNEPANALSNIAFLIAAYFALKIALRRPKYDLLEIFVILLAGSIGIGSFLFHTFANSWSELADVIPIWTFVAVIVLLFIYRSTNENLPKTARIAAISAGITGVIFWFTSGDITTDSAATPALFNGSLQYAPALIALVVFALLTQIRQRPERYYILAATITFFISLIFRSIDISTCDATGIGTHFLWHLCNGLMVGLLLMTLVTKFPPAQK